MRRIHYRAIIILIITFMILCLLALAIGYTRQTPLVSFIADFDDQTDIYLLDPTNRDLFNITQSAFPEWSFGWSHLGTLLYTASIHTTQSADELMVMTRLGDERLLDTPETLYSFGGVWSPTGDTFAYFSSHPRNISDIYTISFPDETVRNLTQTDTLSESNPYWTPDGTDLLYRLNGDLYLLNLASGERRLLVNIESADIESQSPVWSPDGEWLIFYTRSFINGQNRLQAYVVARDGTALRQLRIPTAINSTVTWSPDSQQVAFIGNQNDILFYDLASNRIETVTGTNRRFAPSWSPDGRWIAFIENRHLYVYDTHTAQIRPLLTEGHVKPPLRWQP
ncbi:MAG: DPP IV N-terminal domain-containing protein [Phototrophicaceae bacterium]